MAKQGKPLSKVLDWEALASAPNTHGAFSFLKTAAEVINIQDSPFHKPSVLEMIEPGVTGKVATRAADANPIAVHEEARGTASDIDTGVHMDTVADMTTVVALDSVAGMKVVLDLQAESDDPGDLTRSLRPLKCRSVQDAHTLGETVLYSLLWSTAKPETDETKIFQLGWRQMASLRKGMGDKFCKRNVGGLIRKLALECIRPENTYKREARTYRIHSFKSILARRKAAGYEWVSRDKRRAFVQEDGTPFADPQTSEIPEGNTDTVSITTTVDTYPAELSGHSGLEHPRDCGHQDPRDWGLEDPSFSKFFRNYRGRDTDDDDGSRFHRGDSCRRSRAPRCQSRRLLAYCLSCSLPRRDHRGDHRRHSGEGVCRTCQTRRSQSHGLSSEDSATRV